MASLVLIRHGESEWNALGQWTGLTDVGLTELGRQQARETAKKLENTLFDIAYTSSLIRAQDTLTEVLHTLDIPALPTISDPALNERDYGIYTAQNKWQIKEKYGEDTFMGIRRGWDYPIPEGETLKAVYERVVPFYTNTILPQLKAGKNVLVASHGNTLRALIKYLENISDTEIAHLELKTGEAYVYEINSSGKIVSKRIIV